MKILVTGATGFIGKNCVRRLLAEGHEVVCCGRNFSRFDITSDRVKTVSMELEDREGVRRIFLHEKPDIVYH
jgi:nucleoside-diphosphate-sugar epimerase